MNRANEPKRTVAELLEGAQWKSLSLRLTRYAFACIRGRSWPDAEDFAEGAITNVLDPTTRSWNPAEEPDLWKHLARVVRTDIAAKRMRKLRHRETEYQDETHEAWDKSANEENLTAARASAPRVHGSWQRPADDALIAAQRDAERLEKIHQRFAKDKRVLDVLDLLMRRIDTIAEHAAHLDCTFDEAHSARRRLAKFVAKLEAEKDPERGAKS